MIALNMDKRKLSGIRSGGWAAAAALTGFGRPLDFEPHAVGHVQRERSLLDHCSRDPRPRMAREKQGIAVLERLDLVARSAGRDDEARAAQLRSVGAIGGN